jgi:16S rRNA (guanine527-N7)-methyltransferase
VLTQDLLVSSDTMERIEGFLAFLREENDCQNLVSRGTLDQLWSRHVLDSAQLLRFAPAEASSWIDLGTGAGFPGLIVGLLHPGRVVLVEERKRRIDFLQRALQILGLEERVELHGTKVERFTGGTFDVISARAFAPLDKLLSLSHSFSTAKTRWILPKGRNAASEVEAAQATWHGIFRLEASLTDPDSRIIVAEGVRPKHGQAVPKKRGAR